MRLENALELAREKLDVYGLTHKGWVVEVCNHRRFLGLCCHRGNVIHLSRPFVEQYTQVEVLDTILHEIAHALVGWNHDHDAVWQAMAIQLGATPSPIAWGVRLRKSKVICL